MGSNLAKYGSYEIEAAEEEEQQSQAGGKFLKLKAGKNVVRFLPPRAGVKSPFILTHQHVIEMPGQQKPLSFNCPRLMAKRPCPACAKIDQLRSTGNKVDYERAGAILPRVRVYANVIDRAHPESGPQVLAMGKTIHGQLVELRKDTTDGGDFTDPTEDGFDIVISRKGTQKNDTEYSVRPQREASSLGDDAWIDMQADLTQYARVLSDEELRKLVNEELGGTGGGAPAQASSRRRRSAEDDLEDDD